MATCDIKIELEGKNAEYVLAQLNQDKDKASSIHTAIKLRSLVTWIESMSLDTVPASVVTEFVKAYCNSIREYACKSFLYQYLTSADIFEMRLTFTFENIKCVANYTLNRNGIWLDFKVASN